MFQREFAMRLVAAPGSEFYCRLSVNAQLLSKITHVMKVGRNNFRPPPKVESSVVKIEPYWPAPSVDFEEWDGMLRILFSRKNRTLAANFKTTSVLSLLEKNLRTFCAIQNRPLPESLNGCQPDGMKQLVLSVLESVDFQEKRAAKMDIDDFLKLLEAFHASNIHFK